MTLKNVISLSRCHRVKSGGFSLVEMVVAISILSILSVLVSAGFQSIVGTTEDGQVSDITSTLVRARAYAMANNTYVFVGLQEVSAANAASGTQTSGPGRIAMLVAASSDGTRGYPVSANSNTTLDGSATSLSVVMPLRHYDNLDLLAAPGTGISNLPNSSTTSTTYNVADSTKGTSLTTFRWPPNSSNSLYPTFGGTGVSKNTVIQFNPQGQAQIVNTPYSDSILQWIEIDLAPTHGTTISTSNPATILIDGASGNVTTYRE